MSHATPHEHNWGVLLQYNSYSNSWEVSNVNTVQYLTPADYQIVPPDDLMFFFKKIVIYYVLMTKDGFVNYDEISLYNYLCPK